MLTFTIGAGCETTGEVFPSVIQDCDWVGYHGTASAYSDRIETQGFVRSNRPILDSDIDFVAALAAQHSADPSGKVSGFKMLNSISFSPSPLLALSYAIPGHGGGQGVGYVHEIATLMINQYAGSLKVHELERLKSIVDAVNAIRQSQPVIYAFDLQGIERANFQNGTAAIHVYADIPAGRILAKAFLSPGIDHAAIDGRSLRDEIRRLAKEKAHWISRVPRG